MKKRLKFLRGRSEGEIIEGSFDLLLFFKTIFAVGEVLSGFSLFFISPSWLQSIIARFTDSTLDKNPASPLANFLVNLGQHFTTSAGILAAIYLLIHGIVKLTTLILLWKKILWAYPLSIFVFLGFIVYQLVEFTSSHSIFMVVVSVFDVLLIILTLLEWERMRGKLKHEHKILGKDEGPAA